MLLRGHPLAQKVDVVKPHEPLAVVMMGDAVDAGQEQCVDGRETAIAKAWLASIS